LVPEGPAPITKSW